MTLRVLEKEILELPPRSRVRLAETELFIKVESIHLEKRAIVVEIIAHEPIGYRRFGTYRL